jgi:MinD-like ATPase involved in chromosome partitioning or flagellar assembly
LPHLEFLAVKTHLSEAGYEAVEINTVKELERLLETRSDVGVAILDGENEFDRTLEMYSMLHADGRDVPALMVVPARTLGRMGMGGRGQVRDEYCTRPYSAESLRWRVEAMLIRVESIPNDDLGVMAETDELIQSGSAEEQAELVAARAVEAVAAEAPAEPRNGRIVIVFNPKGGVGKTTIAVNLAAALQIRRNQKVLLIDCDTITGHIASSLGLQNVQTVVDAWNHGGNGTGSFAEIASTHESKVSVLVMAQSPLHTEILEPKRVAEAILAARATYDWVIVDMHPDYGPLNQGIFAQADKIIVPVTPDVPCIRAAVQFSGVAVELAIRDRLAMVVNRANSGVSVSDVERTVGMPALAKVRSAGMLFVKAANEGHSAVERFPGAKVVGDIEGLADRLLESNGQVPVALRVRSRGVLGPSFRSILERLAAQVR